MNKKQVLEILGIEDEQLAHDAFEEELFQIKKKLIEKPLLRLTSKAKVKRLKELKELESILEIPVNFVNTKNLVPVSVPVSEWWKQYQEFKSYWLKSVFVSESASELLKCIFFYFTQEKLFCDQIHGEDLHSETPLFGVKSDEMKLEKGFSLAEKLNLTSFEEIKQCKEEFSSEFLLSLKRLSLLPQYL